MERYSIERGFLKPHRDGKHKVISRKKKEVSECMKGSHRRGQEGKPGNRD